MVFFFRYQDAPPLPLWHFLRRSRVWWTYQHVNILKTSLWKSCYVFFWNITLTKILLSICFRIEPLPQPSYISSLGRCYTQRFLFSNAAPSIPLAPIDRWRSWQVSALWKIFFFWWFSMGIRGSYMLPTSPNIFHILLYKWMDLLKMLPKAILTSKRGTSIHWLLRWFQNLAQKKLPLEVPASFFQKGCFTRTIIMLGIKLHHPSHDPWSNPKNSPATPSFGSENGIDKTVFFEKHPRHATNTPFSYTKKDWS